MCIRDSLINDACFFAGKPLVHGGILRFDGRVTTIIPKKSACYRCVFKKPPPEGLVASCQEAGVIGVLAGIIGTIQATEALKLILGIGRPLTDRLLDFDARRTQFREIRKMCIRDSFGHARKHEYGTRQPPVVLWGTP